MTHKSFSATASIVLAAIMVAVIALAAAPSLAQSDAKVPRYVSLKAAKVNMRKGPGTQYPVEWEYVRRSLPVEIVAEYQHWRRVRDWEGSEGWVHKSMLSPRRTVIVTGSEPRALREEPDQSGSAVARLEPDVIGKLIECEGQWCAVQIEDYNGWMRRAEFWGVYPDEDGKI